MARKIISQIGTLLVVILVVLFCVSGIRNTLQRELPSDPSAALPITDGDAVPPQVTVPPSAPTIPATEPVETLPLEIGPAPEGYFEDALFIGDSRMVGLREYADFPGATFFATNGMSVYSIFYEEMDGTSFTSLIYKQQFGKIYIMLGINELGYDQDYTIGQYEEILKWIRLYQPEAIIFLMANLHVSQKLSESDRIYNNARLDKYNARIAALADGEQIFYLDVNPLFDDGAGNLADKYTADDTHVLGIYYQSWSEWIAENAAVRQAPKSAVNE